MIMKNTMTSTELKVEKYKDEIDLTKEIYITCSCGSLAHIARVCFNRTLEQDRIILDDINFEFNLPELLTPRIDYRFGSLSSYITYPFKLFMARLKAAINIIKGKQVYVNTELCIDPESMMELTKEIIKAIGEIETKTAEIAKKAI